MNCTFSRAVLAVLLVLAAQTLRAETPAESTAAGAAASEPLDGRDGRELLLRNFRPEPTLKTPTHLLTRAKFPAVDVHTHFGLRLRGSQEQLREFVDVMDRHNIAVCVSLDGGLGDQFREHADYLWTNYPDRFVIFATIDWQGAGRPDDPATWALNQPGFAARVAEQLAEAKEQGASGLKIFKQLGLVYRNPDGSLVKVDDPRWDPIWAACGRLGMPVLIHTADPVAFFQPIDETNERWEELSRRPEWSFPPDKFPSHAELLAALLRVVERHPRTTFIGAHVASNAEDLATVGQWLDTYPNLYVDFASRIGELGRQPYSARKFFLRYADRILFSTDGPWPEERLTYYWRLLETWDEYFPYSERPFPPQGFWRIYGLGLPDEVLRKVYYENGARLVPGVAPRLERLGVLERSNHRDDNDGDSRGE